jgi:outer membrane protein assembly factor BamB
LALVAAGCSAYSFDRPAPAGAQWTQFRLNGRHDATLPGSLRVAWRTETGGGFSSSPAIVGSTVYIGNNAGNLYGIDVTNGRIRWRRHFRSPLMSNPLVYNGLVVFGEGDRIWYHGDDQHPAMVGATDNALIAVDRNSGATRWSVHLLGSGMPSPAIVAGAIVHHNGSGEIATIDPLNGRYISTNNAHTVAAMSAILPVGDDRFVTAGIFATTVQEWSARYGKLLWSTSLPERGAGVGDCPPATDGRSIFCDYVAPPDAVSSLAFGEPATERVYAIDEGSGELVWETPLETGPLPRYNVSAIPLVAGNSILVGNAVAPYVHALSVRDGHVLWRLRVGGVVKGGIAIADGVIYFGDFAGYLWAVDARDGRAIGTLNAHTSFNVGSPVIAGRTLIVGSKTGAVIAVPLDVIRSAHD